MNKKHLMLVALLVGLAALVQAAPLGTEFTYQGRVNDSSGPLNGRYDFTFGLTLAASGSAPVVTVTNVNVTVSNGLFTTAVDFGAGIISGTAAWIEIGVRTNGVGGNFSTLSPRQPLTPAPNAHFATLAGTVPNGSINAQKIGAGVPANGNVLSYNGGNLVWTNPATIAPAWRLGGNSGTTAGVNFVGTTDNQPLELRVDNARGLRIEPFGAAAPSLIGGYHQNAAGFGGAVIAGGGTSGSRNEIQGIYGFIGAGHGGRAGAFSGVVGGAYNSAAGEFSFIGGGTANTNSGTYAIISGGASNVIGTGLNAFIGGGLMKFVQSDTSYGFIGGGQANTITSNANHAFIGGGSFNQNTGGGAFIGGGIANRAGNFDAVVVGGALNVNASVRAFIGGGEGNVIEPLSTGATISGGRYNGVRSNSYSSVIAGGEGNVVEPNTQWATIGGGRLNSVRSNNFSPIIAGGEKNVIQNNASFSFIGGGLLNMAAGEYAAIGGGGYNQALGRSAFVGGGGGNDMFGGGPYPNVAAGDWSTVSGGRINAAGGNFSVISGGGQNVTGGDYSTVGGGYLNRALNNYSVVPGGEQNVAAGQYSFAAGRHAQAAHDGSFVWADSQFGDFFSTRSDQFNIRAAGGVRVETGGAGVIIDGQPLLPYSAGNGLQLNGPQFSLRPGSTVTNDNVQPFAFRGIAPSGFWSGPIGLWGQGGVPANVGPAQPAGVLGESGDGVGVWGISAGTGTFNAGAYGLGLGATTGVLGISDTGNGVKGSSISANGVQGNSSSSGASGVYGENTGQGFGVAGRSAGSGIAVYGDNPGGGGYAGYFNGNVHVTGTLTPPSDRNVKRDFSSIDSRAVLEKVLNLPVQGWSYTNSPSVRHLGPIAQDFHAAFNVGADEKSIATVDADGVALAAIQGLNQKMEEENRALRAELKAKASEIRELKDGLADLRRLIQKN